MNSLLADHQFGESVQIITREIIVSSFWHEEDTIQECQRMWKFP